MSHAKNKVTWCLNKAKKEGEKHRGLIQITPDIGKARDHVAKAEHNLNVTFYLQKGGYTDWCSSTLFYTIYHCFLALLAKFGYESRNQECTFALITNFIEEGKINFVQKDLDKVSMLNVTETQESPETAVSIRVEYQYSTKLSLKSEEYRELLQLTKRILDKTKENLEK